MKSKISLSRISIFILIIFLAGCYASSRNAKQQDYSRLMAGSTGSAYNSSTAINDAAGTNLTDGVNNGPGTVFSAGTNNEPGNANGTGINNGTGVNNGGGTNAAGGGIAANRTGSNTTAGDEISLVKITSPLTRGSTGRLTIQGKPGTRYTATAVYRRSGVTITTAENRTTGIDGVATWKWVAAPDTDPGTYSLIVSGGGKMLTTSYTVQ